MKVIQKIFILMLFLSTLTIATTITTWKTDYSIGENIWIELHDKPNNNEDWVGIYPVGSSNDWENVVQWRWARETSDATDPGDWYKFTNLEEGNYEARFFLNNTFVTEASVPFSVVSSATPNIKTWKTNYSTGEDVWIELENKPNNNEDWVGIYPVGSSNDWGNVVQWRWARETSDATDPGDWYKFENLPDGNYEARFFLNNTFVTEDKIEFSVGDNINYAEVGSYLDSVTIETHNDYIVYKPSENLNNMPIVLFASYQTVIGTPNDPNYSVRFEGLMKFVASKGVCVIGATKNPLPIYSSTGVIDTFKNAITETLGRYPNIDSSRLGIIGQSRAGGQIFKIMKELKVAGYGAEKSFVIATDGSFAHGMSKNDLMTFQADSLFIQYGGYLGNITDPRRTLSINKLLPNNINKGFIAIETNVGHDWDAHRYGYGYLNTILAKSKLLKSIGAMIQYEFFDNQDTTAYNIVFNPQKTSQTIQSIIDAPLKAVGDYKYDCDGREEENDPNYYQLQFNYCTEYLN